MDMLKTACDVHAGRRSEKTGVPLGYVPFTPHICFFSGVPA